MMQSYPPTPANTFSPSHNINPTGDGRPTKKARFNHQRGQSGDTILHRHSSQSEGNGEAEECDLSVGPQKPRTRGISACENCRQRKIKCDNQKPACRSCNQKGVNCTYLESDLTSPLSQETGTKILEEIESLKTLFLEQQDRQNRQDRDYSASRRSFQPPLNHSDGSFHQNDHSQPNIRHNTNQGASITHLSSPVGLDSVLGWNVFPQPTPFPTLPTGGDTNALPSHTLPNAEYSELMRLETKYMAYAHTKNPILDPRELHQLILCTAENGLDWSSGTCLVSLVCAIGALSRPYILIQDVGPVSSPNDILSDDDARLALQYWRVAAKRLGFVIGQNDLVAVQCLCLTGIWHMYNLEPLQAWKYFNMASNTWYTSAIVNKNLSASMDEDSGTKQSLTIEQSLYFTCYKSECELTFELNLPGSILANINYPYSFPCPPEIDNQLTTSGTNDSEQRSWYYYLAEIASRHLLNRIIEAQTDACLNPSAPIIRRMLEELEIIETELQQWHASLPPMIAFSVPSGNVTPLPDELSQHLRGRYFAIRELAYRPFVRLCISQPLKISPDLVAKVAAVASQGLQYCCYRLQAGIQLRHHGSWFQLRIVTTCALILIATDRAQQDSGLNAAAKLELPLAWRERVLNARGLLSLHCFAEHGRTGSYVNILDWALRGFSIDSASPSQ